MERPCEIALEKAALQGVARTLERIAHQRYDRDERMIVVGQHHPLHRHERRRDLRNGVIVADGQKAHRMVALPCCGYVGRCERHIEIDTRSRERRVCRLFRPLRRTARDAHLVARPALSESGCDQHSTPLHKGCRTDLDTGAMQRGIEPLCRIDVARRAEKGIVGRRTRQRERQRTARAPRSGIGKVGSIETARHNRLFGKVALPTVDREPHHRRTSPQPVRKSTSTQSGRPNS